jgi:hypothetical protein
MKGDELLSKVYREIMPRIGLTEKDRTKWAVDLINKRELKTPGDWSNLRLELAAFIGLGQYDAISAREDNIDPSEEDARRIVKKWKDIFDTFFKQKKSVPIPPSSNAELSWDTKHRQPFRLEGHDDDWAVMATRPLLDLFLKYGSLVRECPAPAARAEGNERCGNWFLAKRPDQDYCDPKCRSRASTKAKRERDKQKPAKRKKTKKKPK